MLLLCWLLLCATYIAMVWWLARKVPAQQYPLLRQLHWGTLGLCGLGVAAPVLTLGDWTFRSPALFCGLLLVSGLLAGIRGRLRLSRLPTLATAQAVLVGLAAPLLLGYSVEGPSTDTVYADSRYRVTVTEHITWMEENLRYPEVQLYSTRLLLFEQYLGHVDLSASNSQYSTPQMKAWWQGVSALTLAADSNRGMVWRDGVASRFSINPPYRGPAGTAAPASPPAPAEVPPVDNKVYTYVEDMPGIAGIEGIAGVAAAIERRLVLPAHAPHGRVGVYFVVTKQGEVQQARVVEGLSTSTDSAVLATVRQLPRFAPGTQNGQPLNVSLSVSVAVGKEYRR